MSRRKTSRARVLAEMVTSGASTRAALCSRLRLSKASVGRAVGELLHAGHLTEAGRFNDSPRGRKTSVFQVRPDVAFALGTDLQGMALRACVLDATRRVVASGERAVGARWSLERIFGEWTRLIQTVKARSRVPARKFVGLGVGLPGMVSRGTWSIGAYLPPGRWADHNVHHELDRFGLPVVVANNAVCVAEYEHRSGAARGARSFISVLARYGIGAAMYSDGPALVGAHGFTGELGHMRVTARGPRCICGRRGCLDVYASGRTLPKPGARRGTRWARELRKRARYLAIGIGNLVKVFNPGFVLLNGVYNPYAADVEPVLVAALKEDLAPLGIAVPRVVFGEPFALKASIGAAYRVMDAALEAHLAGTLFRG